MSTFIEYSKVAEVTQSTNEEFFPDGYAVELKRVTLAGIAQEGIVLDAGKLNREIEDAVQYYYNKGWQSKLDNVNKTLSKLASKDRADKSAIAELEAQRDEIIAVVNALSDNTAGGLSEYDFVNRIALAILNSKAFRITGEDALLKALSIAGTGDSVEAVDLSATRKEVVPILAEMLGVKECPYLKSVNVKLNLREVSQLVAIANSVKARWTNKGIKVRASKTLATETAIQSILFTCKNAFRMVIPVTSVKDERDYV